MPLDGRLLSLGALRDRAPDMRCLSALLSMLGERCVPLLQIRRRMM